MLSLTLLRLVYFNLVFYCLLAALHTVEKKHNKRQMAPGIIKCPLKQGKGIKLHTGSRE